MAYGIEYYHRFYDIGGTLHRVELLKKDYAGAATALDYAEGENPITLRHVTGGKNQIDDKIIFGQELLFNFYVAKDDIETYDDIFESEYKDYQIKYYVGGETSTYLEFVGVLKPDNMYREFIKKAPYIKISLSATDGLADLQDIEFRDYDFINNAVYEDRLTLIEVIKNALLPLDQSYYNYSELGVLNLDFRIQLNTYETTHMSVGECPFELIYVDCRMFFEETETGENAMSCWEVITEVLRPFNCILKQYKGKYYIINYFELNGYLYSISWDDVGTATPFSCDSAPTTNIIDITDYQVKYGVELQKIHPIKTCKVMFKNEDRGGSAVSYPINNWNSITTPWTTNGFTGINAQDNDTKVLLTSVRNDETDLINLSTGEEGPYFTLKSDFAAAKGTGGATYLSFRLTFSVEQLVNTLFPDATPELQLRITVKRPNGTWGTPYMISVGVQTGEHDYDIHYYAPTHSGFQIIADGDYNVKVEVLPKLSSWIWKTLSMKFGNIGIWLQAEYVNAIETVNMEKSHIRYTVRSRNNIRGQGLKEVDLLFGDGHAITEVGALTYYDDDVNQHLTTELWLCDDADSAGEEESLIDLYLRRILNNCQRYKNYLRLTIIDRDNTLGFNNIIELDGRYYIWVDYEKSARIGEVRAALAELIPDNQELDDAYDEDIILNPTTGTIGGVDEDDVITQESHGFAVGDFVRLSSGTYSKALSTTTDNSKLAGMVVDVPTEDTFKLVSEGYVSNSIIGTLTDEDGDSLDQGEYYYLSPKVAGKMSKTPLNTTDAVKHFIGVKTKLGLKIDVNAIETDSHIEADTVVYPNAPFDDHSVTVTFDRAYGAVPVGDEPKIYRMTQMPNGTYRRKSLRWGWDDDSQPTTTGFSLTIDANESLTGAVMVYEFKKKTTT